MDFVKKNSELSALAIAILEKIKKSEATDAEVHMHTDTGFFINVCKQRIETMEHYRSKNLEITIYLGKKIGRATTSDFSNTAIADAMQKALYIARFTEEDPCLGLASRELMAFNYSDLDLYHPWHITTEEAINLAKANETQGLQCKKINGTEEASIATSQSTSVYANSNDFLGIINRTKHSMGCVFIAEENGHKERDGYHSIARKSSNLVSHTHLATTAAERTMARLGAKKITSRNAPIIFSRDTAAALINNFLRTIAGTNIYRRSSFLVDSIGKKIFPPGIAILEDPTILGALGSTPFDQEGIQTQPSPIVSDGMLQRYLLDSYCARKLNLKTTGNCGGIHNIIVNGVEKLDFPMLLKKMHQGLVVTELLGGDINIVTGNYSCGAFGYWVENGTIEFPVTSITIAGNLRDMFLGIIALGNDIEYSSKILTGSILVNEMAIAGH